MLQLRDVLAELDVHALVHAAEEQQTLCSSLVHIGPACVWPLWRCTVITYYREHRVYVTDDAIGGIPHHRCPCKDGDLVEARGCRPKRFIVFARCKQWDYGNCNLYRNGRGHDACCHECPFSCAPKEAAARSRRLPPPLRQTKERGE
jgi:hypothetical protein